MFRGEPNALEYAFMFRRQAGRRPSMRERTADVDEVNGSVQRVFRCVQGSGSLRPDQIARHTGLSAATVSRAVRQLVAKNLLVPRADMVPQGKRGRPSVPVQVDRSIHGVVGVHLRRADVTVGLADLAGHLIDEVVVESFLGDDGESVRFDRLATGVAEAVEQIRRRHPGRLPIAAGLTAAWREFGLDMDRVAAAVSARIGYRARALEHVVASGLSEHAIGAQGAPGRHVYFYARDTIGFCALTESASAAISTQSGYLTHFPAGTRHACFCGRTGCLGVSASDRMIAARAFEDGLVGAPRIEELYREAGEGNTAVLDALERRAVLLGRAAAFTHDMLVPDRIVLIGEAIAIDAAPREVVRDSLISASTLPGAEGRASFGYFGADLIPAAAVNTGLRVVLEDPLAALTTVEAGWAASAQAI